VTSRPKPTSAGAPAVVSAFSPGVVVGRLMAGSTATQPRVDFAGNRAGPVEARTTLQLSAATLEQAVATGQGVVLVFEHGDPALPIVVGLIQAPEVSPLQALLATPRAAAGSSEQGPARREARLDGDRVVLEGKREIVLKCGEATLTLRRDGKILIRGAYVETYSKGVNRIKGGSVKIN
jgi:hypothetical protein